jgi:hypothetical protein
MVANLLRAEDPRPELDIERPGLAADIDGRRDTANAILADQSGADHGEAAQGQQPTRLLPRAIRERMGTLLRRVSHRHNQAMSHTSAIVEPSQLSPAVTL